MEKHLRGTVQEKELTAIKISPKDLSLLHWNEEDEFEYQGKMYDLVYKKQSNDSSIIYYCIDDKKEETLIANLDELVENQMKNNHPTNQMLRKIFELLSIIDFKTKEEKFIAYKPKNSFLSKQVFNYNSPLIFVESPPPQA
ncbi:MAG: hypothetical protein WCP57_07090 [Bacteroidota bacterium]